MQYSAPQNDFHQVLLQVKLEADSKPDYIRKTKFSCPPVSLRTECAFYSERRDTALRAEGTLHSERSVHFTPSGGYTALRTEGTLHSERGVPPHPEQGVPPHPEQGVPPHPKQGVPPHPERGVPPHPEQGVPLHPVRGVPPHPVQGVPPHPVRRVLFPTPVGRASLRSEGVVPYVHRESLPTPAGRSVR